MNAPTTSSASTRLGLGRCLARRSIESLQADARTSGLPRTLSAFNLVLLGIGCIVGAGIYVLPGQAERIPSACHTDHTARVQTVDHDTNPRFHALLNAFGRRTGVPVLVNTSFNVRGEPIVCTPRAAIEAFYGTPLDALVIGPFILEK